MENKEGGQVAKVQEMGEGEEGDIVTHSNPPE